MHTEDIKEAVQLFDNAEKWKAFVELAEQKGNLQTAMHATAYMRLKSHFLKDSGSASWSYKPLDDDNHVMIWYLTAYGDNSICLLFGWQGQLWLEARGGETCFDVQKIVQLLHEPRFKDLLAGFDRIDNPQNGSCLATEVRNFCFGTANEPITHFSDTSLAWHAQFETDSYLEQVIAKVAKFQTPEMTMLFDELNKATRR